MLKKTMLKVLHATGLFAPFRLANRAKVLILTYHRFSPDEVEGKISAYALAEHLKYLTAHYRILPLSQIVALLAQGKAPPPGAAALTIDDGYEDAYQVAFPLLHRYRVPATLFVATDFVQGKIWLWPDKLRYLTLRTAANELVETLNGCNLRLPLSDQASRLAAASRANALLKLLPDELKEETISRLAVALDVPLPPVPPAEYAPLSVAQMRELDGAAIEIGSHTVTHPILTNVGDERLRGELAESKAWLEKTLRREVPLFCYPNGKNDARVQRAVAAAGYHCAVANIPELNTSNSSLLALCRIAAPPDLTHFIQYTSGFEITRLKLLGYWPYPAPKLASQPQQSACAKNEHMLGVEETRLLSSVIKR